MAALSAVRAAMRNFSPQPLAALLVPSEDSHNSEYIAACDQRRAFVSGFTGSAGWAIITPDQALLWTDGRYFLQASKQLDSSWTLMKAGLPDTPTQEQWLKTNLPSNARIGYDPELFSYKRYQQITEVTASKHFDFVPTKLVDEVWASARPAKPSDPIYHLPLAYTGITASEKLAQIRTQMMLVNADVLVLSALDDIAYLTNLRGSDVACTPVFFAYATVTRTAAFLYTDSNRLTAESRSQLATASIQVREYATIFSHLPQLVENSINSIWLATTCNQALRNVLQPSSVIHEAESPLVKMKAIKCAVELEGFRKCHEYDGAALVAFLAQLEAQLLAGVHVTECEAANALEHFRAAQPDFISCSFDTISSSGPNAAIIHYKPEPATCSVIDPARIYLVDSGGQYKNGTTDITRTVHFGEPTAFERECFTRVLKGHIALARTSFPSGITGQRLDSIARLALWEVGLDYAHGTGHGVGHCSCVHEGPQRITHREGGEQVPLQLGMIISNEPGYYQDEEFGIRIENLVEVVPATLAHNFAQRGFLTFNTISLAPIQLKMIEKSLLSEQDLAWLNHYHAQVRSALSPILQAQGLHEALTYLERETVPLHF